MMKAIIFTLTLVFLVCEFSYSQCTDSGNQWAKSWVSCQTSANPNNTRGNSHWILYEFLENHYIDSSYVWNANRVGESLTGLKEVVIDYSLDGSTWIELGNYTFPQGSELETYEGFDGPVFGSVYIKKILITVLSTHGGGSCASLGEIQFQVDNSKCHGEIDACGECNGPGMFTYYIDADGDGKGSESSIIQSCEPVPGYVLNADDDCDSGEIGWGDIAPIFVNSCNGCHIENSSSGLNLGSYDSFKMGGVKCGTAIADDQNLVGIISIPGFTGGCGDPTFVTMNSLTGGNEISAADLDKIQRWIDGGAPENCGDFCIEEEVIDTDFGEGMVGYFMANQKISSDSELDSASIITFEAGLEILLNEGFSVLNGGQFIAQIGGCDD